MHKLTACALLAFTLIAPQTCHALGTFSRACRFYAIPTGSKTIAAKFFHAMGAPSLVLDLPGKTNEEQGKYWVLESITADYFQVRYYLFASSIQYMLSSISYDGGTYYYSFYRKLDSPWTAEAISNAMMTDPDFSPYYVNRGPYYSVRAGVDSIVENQGATFANAFYIIGKHSYFDAVGAKAQISLPDTRAIDCNLGNWGFGLFDR